MLTANHLDSSQHFTPLVSAVNSSRDREREGATERAREREGGRERGGEREREREGERERER